MSFELNASVRWLNSDVISNETSFTLAIIMPAATGNTAIVFLAPGFVQTALAHQLKPIKIIKCVYT